MYLQEGIRNIKTYLEIRKIIFCCRLEAFEGHCRKEPDPDPLVKGTDPGRWFHHYLDERLNLRACWLGHTHTYDPLRLLRGNTKKYLV
jgi:hypothetical protein